MVVDVYNFNDIPQTVTLTGHAYGGWSVGPADSAESVDSVDSVSVKVAPMERVAVPFTVVAGGAVDPRVDYPLVFETTLGDEPVPPSVSRIQLATSDRPGAPIPLAPTIDDIAPGVDADVSGPEVELRASITDSIAGVDPSRVEVEVDGAAVDSQFDPEDGRLSASLRLAPGRHEIWIRAVERAHAPAQAVIELEVSG